MPEFEYESIFGAGKVKIQARDIAFDINYRYSGPRDETQKKNCEDARIAFMYHQNNPNVHPYTCGVNSAHENLVMRFTYHGKCFLVCPSCGYIQDWNNK